jgi:hypothetical protein
MQPVRYFLLSGLLMALATFPARADLTGSTVTGTFIEGTYTGNFFDPAFATIPDGYQNKIENSTAIVIEPGQSQFGAELGCWRACNLITAVFTDTQLDIGTQAGFWFGDTFHFQFEDPAFTGISLVSNTFTNFWDVPSVDFGISGDTISVDVILNAFGGQDFDAVFDVSSASDWTPTDPPVPEPSSFLWLAAGLTALVAAKHRTRSFVKLGRLL